MNQHLFPENQEVLVTLTIQPDACQINGDSLQAFGTIETKMGTRKVKFKYRLKNALEKQQWQTIEQAIDVSVQGTFVQPNGPSNLGAFNYRHYLATQGVVQILEGRQLGYPQSRPLQLGDFNQLLAQVRKKASNHCIRQFKPLTASFMQSLFFGEQDEIFREQSQQLDELGWLRFFRLTGIQALFFLQMFTYLWLRLGFTKERLLWGELLFSIVYLGLTGGGLGVQRVLLSKLIQACNQRWRWHLSALDCWSLGLLVLLICQPLSVFSINGFLAYGLSFCSLVAMPVIAEGVTRRSSYCAKLQRFLFLQVLAVPFLALVFQKWQLGATLTPVFFFPFLRYFLLPVLTFAYGCSLILPVRPLAMALEKMFEGLTFWVTEAATMPSVSYTFGQLPFWLFLVVLSLVLLGCYQYHRVRLRSYLCFLSLLFLFAYKYVNPTGIVAFIDVGQGDCIFIQQTFHQENILIDTGGQLPFIKEPWAQRKTAQANCFYTVLPVLKYRGVQTLDKVFITHGDVDHCGDLLQLASQIKIKELYYPAGTTAKPFFAETIQQLRQQGVSCYEILAPASVATTFSLNMLAPDNEGLGENEDSMVLYTELGGQRFLFTGDLDRAGERHLTKQWPALKVDILKVGHHGSRTATDEAFLAQVQPHTGVISAGRANRFSHPHEETTVALTEANCQMLQTKELGMIYYQWTPWQAITDYHSMNPED